MSRVKSRVKKAIWLKALCVWVVGGVAVVAMTLLRRPSPIDVRLTTTRATFWTTTNRMFGSADYEDVIISGVARIEVKSSPPRRIVVGRDDPLASCAITNVRGNGLQLDDKSLIRLDWREGTLGETVSISSSNQM